MSAMRVCNRIMRTNEEKNCPEACGIFQTRDGTRVSCTGRRILYHCTTREAPTSHISAASFIGCD